MYPYRDTFEQLYPARDTLHYVIKAWWKTAEKTLTVFTFGDEHKHEVSI